MISTTRWPSARRSRVPSRKILGITSAFGGTALGARMLDRLLCDKCDSGRRDIAVAVGVEKHHPRRGGLQAGALAARTPARQHPQAVDFRLKQIGEFPGETTLTAIAPLTKLGAAIEIDKAAFKKLKPIVTMGGPTYRGYGDVYARNDHPDRKYGADLPTAAPPQISAGESGCWKFAQGDVVGGPFRLRFTPAKIASHAGQGCRVQDRLQK
jgi:purine nucleosidase